jgi:UDP-N-acetylmuramate: L-alanyl-gamma-D-glutamyl-meso-diaminopimelate ligase
MRVHVVAVAGTGMGSLAGLLGELGHEVTGSDVAFDPPMGPALRDWGIRCLEGFRPEHLQPPPDLVVVGNVCRRDNPEARAAIDAGLRTTHIAGALAELVLPGSSPLVVAGTHGKTTTTALAAWLLEKAGRAPGFLVGGIPNGFGRSFRAPRRRSLPVGAALRGPPFVLEGDEYDTAFFEKTAKFLHYRAEVAIVTSIEHDHVDIYPTFDAYREAFRAFVAGVPESGLVVAHAGDPQVVELVSAVARAPVAWYGVAGEIAGGVPPHWLAAPGPSDARGQSFDLFAGGVAAGRHALPLPGRHNLRNALAAIAAVAQGFGVGVHELAPGLASFAGVRRRQELIGEPGGVFVYDDFAHHPTAVDETLRALRTRHPRARLFAVFEPRSATACRALHQAQYESAFGACDRVLLAPLGRSGLASGEALDLGRLASTLAANGKPASACGSLDEIVERLAAETCAGDVVALLSNGAFGGIHARVLSRLAAR